MRASWSDEALLYSGCGGGYMNLPCDKIIQSYIHTYTSTHIHIEK